MIWRYHGMGTCSVCDDGDARLFLPADRKDLRLILWPPVCQRCIPRVDIEPDSKPQGDT